MSSRGLAMRDVVGKARSVFCGCLFVVVVACLGACSSAKLDASESGSNSTAAMSNSRQLDKIGVQLYTVRNLMEQDFEGTLRKIAEIGFDEVEFAGFFGRDPSDIKVLLDELGLDPVASHVNWEMLRKDPERLIAETVALGAPYMVLAWFPAEERESIDDWLEWIELFNDVGKRAAEQGITFAYHNHEFEFERMEGLLPFDLILEKIDTRYVKIELDLYWITMAGFDPVDYFHKLPGHYPLTHVKDLRTSDQSIMTVGQGDIDFAEIFANSERGGIRYFVVEHDNPENPLESIRQSLEYLRSLRF